ncbi:TIGR04028 family ABC transporter substrate-binding protein [Corynebacterium doosanense]|uniref:ABC transporter substrate-binding protein n=1 Tax=Corynebacterium doosanense CAU 212 = DSM 45436 TaxID=558173 RepID=A0A097IHS6_9CORY|nr:TIGR04028 family ABC transporter substrate-binding protein [Corynebacterium doosanense]AIT61697.1 ABC transporter substrate-binding protein [Corynebacterium doosanense CAU 212 = DSM 45436]
MAVIAAAAAASLLAACTSTPSEDTQESEQTLTYLEPIFFTTLYPPAAGFYPNGNVMNQIGDRLLYQDPDTLELSPWIATDLPQVNEDATEYTFDLRTDVTYSDGTPLTPENVVANFDLYGKGDKSRKLTASEQITNYDHGEVVDEDTVRFHFSAPAPGFAQATSTFNASLLADSSLEFANEQFAPGNATNIIGSGPFVIADEQLGTELTLTAREDYDWAPAAREHQGRAQLDNIHYVLAAEESVRTGALVAGQADIARQIEAPVETHLLQQGLQIVSAPTNGVNNSLNFRFKNPLLADIRVRQAIIAGVDRENIKRILFSDSYPLATSALSSTARGYKEQEGGYVHDPDRARELLDDAGWTPGADGIREKDGQRLSLTVNEAIPQPRSREVITMIQEQLGEIGIEIHLNPGDQATQDAMSKDFTTIPVRHTMVGRADYDVIKSHLYSANRNELLNATLVDGTEEIGDPVLEELLMKVASSPREEDRAAASGQVQDYLTEQAYMLPLFEEPVVYGLQPYVRGFAPESVGRASFYEASIDTELKKELS